MKAYGISPVIDLADPEDSRVQACISLVTDIVCQALRARGDCFHYAVDWRDPGGPEWSTCTEDLAKPQVHTLSDPREIARLVRMSVDPFSGKAAIIRSIATCRAVTFGYDGQAFLCLRHEDDPPTSSDPSLVTTEDRSDLLADTDYFDGFLPAN
ncbi:hypothetical protein [Allosphingosinicella deserti]|uniref:Uncharacterized protein n=1 Tax=Allosphingosinicella deserti TaxID=2116704 RepID=A0A2P7QIU6_9SPHN|nr:hypothetical protein [Sphingomonas deserti]PSJ37883.1 hypothetical protein C7I55_19420 [Sphingomonas deserti]